MSPKPIVAKNTRKQKQFPDLNSVRKFIGANMKMFD